MATHLFAGKYSVLAARFIGRGGTSIKHRRKTIIEMRVSRIASSVQVIFTPDTLKNPKAKIDDPGPQINYGIVVIVHDRSLIPVTYLKNLSLLKKKDEHVRFLSYFKFGMTR